MLKALDLFCGGGGASWGLHLAGFEVWGIDIKPQPRYPFRNRFIQADALKPPVDLAAFDLIWASPPCQAFTMAQNAAKNRHAHPNLIPETREMLDKSKRPYIIENVVGAPLRASAMLCGLAFGLQVKRHRLFETNFIFFAPDCGDHDQDYYVIFGHECRNRRKGDAAGRKNRIDVGRAAMGIDWMTRGELSEAIPPAYSHYIATQWLKQQSPAPQGNNP